MMKELLSKVAQEEAKIKRKGQNKKDKKGVNMKKWEFLG